MCFHLKEFRCARTKGTLHPEENITEAVSNSHLSLKSHNPSNLISSNSLQPGHCPTCRSWDISTADTHIKSHSQRVHRWVHAQCQLINTRTEKRGARKKCSNSTTHRSWSNPTPILNTGQEQQWDVSCTYGILPTAFPVTCVPLTVEWDVVTAPSPVPLLTCTTLNSLIAFTPHLCPPPAHNSTIIKVVPTPHWRLQKKDQDCSRRKSSMGRTLLTLGWSH